MWTTSLIMILESVALVLLPRPFSLTAVGMICISSFISYCCVMQRRLWTISPDRYDIKMRLSRREENDLRRDVGSLQAAVAIYVVALCATTFALHILCGLTYLVVAMGIDEVRRESVRGARIASRISLFVSSGLFWCRFQCRSTIKNQQQDIIRKYCIPAE